MQLLPPALEAFLATARVGTVQGAARELGLTQTAVTQRLRGLEGRLGSELFRRSRRGMALTPDGEAVLRYCRSAQELEGETLAGMRGRAEASRPGSGARLRITGPSSLMRSRVLPAGQELARRYPGLSLSFRLEDRGGWIEELRTGAADLAIAPPGRVERELASRLLRPERYLLIGPQAWRGRALADILATERAIDFEPGDRATQAYLEHFGLASGEARDRHFVNNTEELARLVEAGLGYGVLTEEFAERFLKRCRIVLLNRGRVWEQRLAAAWYARAHPAPYWREFLSALK